MADTISKISINGTTYDIAGTSSSTTAETADTLTTARTIDGVSFDGSANVIHYGSCSTAAATAAKTVSVSNFTLATGARVLVRFTNGNTASSPTLNVNSTGAKNIRYLNAAVPSGYIVAYGTYEFVYGGTYWYLVGDLTASLASDLSTSVDSLSTSVDSLSTSVDSLSSTVDTLSILKANSTLLLSAKSIWNGFAQTASFGITYGTTSENQFYMIEGYRLVNYYADYNITSDFGDYQEKGFKGREIIFLGMTTDSDSDYVASKYVYPTSQTIGEILFTPGDSSITVTSAGTSTTSFYLSHIYLITIGNISLIG